MACGDKHHMKHNPRDFAQMMKSWHFISISTNHKTTTAHCALSLKGVQVSSQGPA